jgi:hypothetical protein
MNIRFIIFWGRLPCDPFSAWKWLEAAFDLSGAKQVKLMALNDPDLEPLWTEIGEI